MLFYWLINFLSWFGDAQNFPVVSFIFSNTLYFLNVLCVIGETEMLMCYWSLKTSQEATCVLIILNLLHTGRQSSLANKMNTLHVYGTESNCERQRNYCSAMTVKQLLFMFSVSRCLCIKRNYRNKRFKMIESHYQTFILFTVFLML